MTTSIYQIFDILGLKDRTKLKSDTRSPLFSKFPVFRNVSCLPKIKLIRSLKINAKFTFPVRGCDILRQHCPLALAPTEDMRLSHVGDQIFTKYHFDNRPYENFLSAIWILKGGKYRKIRCYQKTNCAYQHINYLHTDFKVLTVSFFSWNIAKNFLEKIGELFSRRFFGWLQSVGVFKLRSSLLSPH